MTPGFPFAAPGPADGARSLVSRQHVVRRGRTDGGLGHRVSFVLALSTCHLRVFQVDRPGGVAGLSAWELWYRGGLPPVFPALIRAFGGQEADEALKSYRTIPLST